MSVPASVLRKYPNMHLEIVQNFSRDDINDN